MRLINSIKNVGAAMTSYILAMLIGIVAQSILVRYLGIEYNGLNGLFSNIVSMLSIAELGIGSAVVYHLYRPIAEKDTEKIKSLMGFYKKAYRFIAVVIGIVGICIIPFLNIIVGETTISSKEIYVIFGLFLFDTVCSYLLTYKRSLLYADQKNYVINLIHILYTVFLNAVQIYIIITMRNFILYLIVKVIFRILENLIITIYTNKKYPYILEKNIEKLDNDIFKDIMKKVKALLYHKVGGYLIDGTDNVIISMFLGISSVGIITNYKVILNAMSSLISQIFNAITASVGNLLVSESKEKVYDTYKKLSLMNFFVFYISSIVLCMAINLIIKVIYGGEYLMGTIEVCVLMTNFYMQGMKKNIQLFKEAACIFYEDRYMPLLEAIANLVLSVILVKFLGIAGVILGSILSSLVVFLYSYPKYVYKKIMDRKRSEYIFEQFKYLLIFIITMIIIIILQHFIKIDNNVLNLLVNVVISFIISGTIFIITYYRTNEFKYYKGILFDALRKIMKGKNNEAKSKL